MYTVYIVYNVHWEKLYIVEKTGRLLPYNKAPPNSAPEGNIQPMLPRVRNSEMPRPDGSNSAYHTQ